MSSTESESESSIIESTPTTKVAVVTSKPEATPKIATTYYTYVLSLLVVAIVIGLLYHSYSCYCTNQDIYEDSEGFIEKTVKSGTDSDSSFDVDNQVNQLIRKQEEYLSQLQKNE
jgi:uncharacterized protein HemX